MSKAREERSSVEAVQIAGKAETIRLDGVQAACTTNSTISGQENESEDALRTRESTPNVSSINDGPRKSILRNVPSKSISNVNADVLMAAIRQQQPEGPFLQRRDLSSNDRIKSAVNYGIDSSLRLNATSLNLNQPDNRSISSIKRSYASLPLSTPAVGAREIQC